MFPMKWLSLPYVRGSRESKMVVPYSLLFVGYPNSSLLCTMSDRPPSSLLTGEIGLGTSEDVALFAGPIRTTIRTNKVNRSNED